MTARKISTRRRTARRKSSGLPPTAAEALTQLERRLPRNLRGMVKDLRKNLGDLQKQVDKARADRDARWRKIETQVRRDTVRLLRRIEKAVAPAATSKKSKKSPKRKAARKKTASKKTARKKTVRKKTARKKAARR